ncbi:polyamine aminopropyltransferase [Bacillota bacterium LX-D]|nr:polyamine aminopropyltransferase [Bacillota bacterium LX-D]
MELWYTENHSSTVRFSMKVKQQIFSQTSPFQKIDILDTYEFGKVLVIDGLVMLTEKDEFVYHEMIVHVPMAVNPDIKKVLVIGGGDGGTVRELTRYPSIEKIDMVEIDEIVVRACQEHLPSTASKLEDPRVNLYFEDGIKFVQGKESIYDLVIVDSTDPIGPGEGLFTKEFYQNCYNILTKDGILVNQNESPFYSDTIKEMQRATSKRKAIFPICEVYQMSIPTYPSGLWMFGFAGKTKHPIKDLQTEKWLKFKLLTKYYNPELHVGSFALPNYVRELLSNGEK